MTALLSACGGGGGGGGGGESGSSGASGTSTPASGSTTSTPTARTLKVSWATPTTREDGSSLAADDIAGYQIYYYKDGDAQGSGETLDIKGGKTNSAQIQVNGSGTYHFAITASDASGAKSDLSEYTTVTLN